MTAIPHPSDVILFTFPSSPIQFVIQEAFASCINIYDFVYIYSELFFLCFALFRLIVLVGKKLKLLF